MTSHLTSHMTVYVSTLHSSQGFRPLPSNYVQWMHEAVQMKIGVLEPTLIQFGKSSNCPLLLTSMRTKTKFEIPLFLKGEGRDLGWLLVRLISFPVWRFQLSAVFSFPNDQIR